MRCQLRGLSLPPLTSSAVPPPPTPVPLTVAKGGPVMIILIMGDGLIEDDGPPAGVRRPSLAESGRETWWRQRQPFVRCGGGGGAASRQAARVERPVSSTFSVLALTGRAVGRLEQCRTATVSQLAFPPFRWCLAAGAFPRHWFPAAGVSPRDGHVWRLSSRTRGAGAGGGGGKGQSGATPVLAGDHPPRAQTPGGVPLPRGERGPTRRTPPAG